MKPSASGRSSGAGAAAGFPRILDIALSALGLIATLPLLAGAGAAVALTSRGGVFFRQRRVGRGGASFVLLKLRTMRAGPGSRVTAAGDPRITPVGRFLRRSKLDELPQLINILAGHMSFVGPRPEVPDFVDLRDPRWGVILSTRPGLTDPVTLDLLDEEALLAGSPDPVAYYRTSLQPVKLDGYVAYLGTRTPRGDLGVLLRTLAALVPGKARRAPSQELSRTPDQSSSRVGVTRQLPEEQHP